MNKKIIKFSCTYYVNTISIIYGNQLFWFANYYIALLPSLNACLANSPGKFNLTEVYTSLIKLYNIIKNLADRVFFPDHLIKLAASLEILS